MTRYKAFYITYDVFFHKGITLRDKEIIVRNNANELNAKIKLEGYLKKKYEGDFKHMQITKCEDEDTVAIRTQQRIMRMMKHVNKV